MRNFLRTTLLTLLLLTGPAGAGIAAEPATASSHVVAVKTNPAPASPGSISGQRASATSPTPSPGDSASTGPANAGTGESAQNESTRLNYTPWVIAGVAVLVIIAILIFRRRRNTTIVG